MNDQQFEALLAVLGRIAEGLEEIDQGLAMLAATYVKINDPKGWARIEEIAEEEADDDINGLA